MKDKKKLSFLIFNFGYARLKNLWHTMNVVTNIRKDNGWLEDQVEFILIEHGEEKYSEKFAKKMDFTYIYHFDPLMTSHRSELRNAAVDAASADWVILHDNDIIPTPTFFHDILNILSDKDLTVDYFSNFSEVINLSNKLTNTLIKDVDKGPNKFKYGYINGTKHEETNNFKGCDVRPHGFFTFTEATGGSFTIKKSVYLDNKFNDDYEGWGAEDNAFKLGVVGNIGWGRFGMMNQALLHSYHQIGVFDPNSGSLQINNAELNENRHRLYNQLTNADIVKDAKEYVMVSYFAIPDLIIAEVEDGDLELPSNMSSL